MSSDSAVQEPPYYVLTRPLPNASSQAPANFAHPVIEYHFADDPPSLLLPSSETQSVIIIDYDDLNSPPVAQSLNQNLAVAGVKVSPAPGASAAPSTREGDLKRNDQMYIIETLGSIAAESSVSESLYDLDNPQLILSQFRERNVLLRRVLDQPSTKLPASRPEPEVLPSDET
ncbi:uncharacterized protein FOMMEDRAFT_155276 [Fomitiporia mediterranea MF3/22]|uniref:uncharacterized protein n=1 Tax=Fomitiporia mediterranea (strain MF3/22) TaxID=694068 RepID=UPI0004407A98|nr:uncharacterized protein FOMMEDRAFT_155276 [Fomitiporia mediterranea MF3/22]EJD04156.1 hypothetical protein FOMMEDRAFT_155276 [Fomitiporia mediterranea MF3/22]